MYALIVDDSRAMRMMIGRIVRSMGYQTIEAGDGVEALEVLAASETPRLILVDWNMPNMNGLELVQKIRCEPRYRDTTVVMVTTETEMDNMTRAIEAGADEYIMKPFTSESLAEKLEEVGEFGDLV